MPSCIGNLASGISPLDRSGPATPAAKPSRAPVPQARPPRRLLSSKRRAGSPRGRRRPPAPALHRPQQAAGGTRSPRQDPARSLTSPPFPHSPFSQRRPGASRRRRRPARCSSAAGVTAAKGGASAGAGRSCHRRLPSPRGGRAVAAARSAAPGRGRFSRSSGAGRWGRRARLPFLGTCRGSARYLGPNPTPFSAAACRGPQVSHEEHQGNIKMFWVP